MFERFYLLAYFLRTRYFLNFKSRSRLLAWQKQQLNTFLKRQLPRSPYYASWNGKALEALPIVDKAEVMANFSAMNTAGVQLEDAMTLALNAETSRDFKSTLGDISIGLSSGTSGNRGLFMANAKERNQWAGILLARLLPSDMLMQLLMPWRPPLRIAFFLRANSNVYTTLSSRRVDFVFYDLFDDLQNARVALQNQKPDVLVAPANVLKILAEWVDEGLLNIHPHRVISVAEVLEDDDRAAIKNAFGTQPMQIYQATEGLLGYTCEAGQLHLNETFLHIEKEWLDTQKTRFQPIITDFTRSTQLVVRYRLNDVLLIGQPCSCKRSETVISAIEGRTDDVIWLTSHRNQKLHAIFPDFIRRAMLMAGEIVNDYRVVQDTQNLIIELSTADAERARKAVEIELNKLWLQQAVIAPRLSFERWQQQPSHNKRRRVYCKQKPVENSLHLASM